MAAGYLIGLIFSGPGVESFDANTVKILLCQLAVMLAEGALFYAISTVLQKTGGSIAVCLVLPMVLTIVLTLADTALAEKAISLSAYWLERISGTLSSFDVKSADMKKALLTALGYWNEWFLCMLYVTEKKLYPLQYLLMEMQKNSEFLARNSSMIGASGAEALKSLPSQTMRMAVVVFIVLPIACAYPFFQRYVVAGLTIGSVKG